MTFSRYPVLFLLVIGLIVLAACGTAVSENEPLASGGSGGGIQSEPTNTTQPTPTDEPTEESVPTATEIKSVPETELSTEEPTMTEEGETVNGKPVLTEDDRSESLQRLTASWNTNWNRHIVDYDEILSGGPPRDGIPSIDDPQFVSIDEAADWLADNEPVIALEIEGEARAYPLQILTWHEIANDTVGDIPVAVTFCPLCNSALVFDRRVDGETLEFGVSGLLRNSDLIMYDRTTETLWQQFTGEAIIGDLVGEQLEFVPSGLVSFAEFREAYPEGMVQSRETGFSRSYGQNPYAGYDRIGQNPFLFTGELDGRLPAMERVVTVNLPDENIDVAYPLSLLSEMGVIHDNQGGQDIVVFHTEGTSSALGAATIADAEDVGATGVFDPNLNGQMLTFTKTDGVITDEETGSTWNVLGQATAGELAGEALTPIVHGNHFWFSWVAFRPDTIVFSS
jgi:hypothetical protein